MYLLDVAGAIRNKTIFQIFNRKSGLDCLYFFGELKPVSKNIA